MIYTYIQIPDLASHIPINNDKAHQHRKKRLKQWLPQPGVKKKP